MALLLTVPSADLPVHAYLSYLGVRFVSLSFIVFGVYFVTRFAFNIFDPIWRWAMVALIAAAYIYTYHYSAPNPGKAWFRMRLSGPILIIPFAAFWYFAAQDQKALTRFSLAVSLSLLLYLPVLRVHFLLLPAEEFSPTYDLLPFLNIRDFGSFAMLGIAGFTGLAWQFRTRPLAVQALLLLALVISWTALFWSGGRAPVVALIACLVGIPILFRGTIGASIRGVVSAIVGLGLSTLLPPTESSLDLVERLSNEAYYSSLSSFSSNRLDIWSAVWQKILERPLLGHGFSQMNALEGTDHFGFVASHSFILDSLLDFGIIGGIPILALVWITFGQIVWRYRLELPNAALPPLMMLTTLMVQRFVDGIFHQFHTLMYACLLFPLLLSASYRSERR